MSRREIAKAEQRMLARTHRREHNHRSVIREDRKRRRQETEA